MELIIKLKYIAKMIAVFYLFLVVFIFIFQRKMQYFPYGKIDDGFYKQCCSKEILTTQDSLKILSYYKKPEAGKKIILYFHGNAGNLSSRSHRIEAFVKQGFGAFIVAYRGYPGSQGKPSQQGLMLDAKAALAFLLDQGYDYKDIILFGESLGSGVAMQMASQNDYAAMILDSPFSSVTSVAKSVYWYLPVGLLLKDRFESIKLAPNISTPTLIVHGDDDQVVPIAEGKKLFQAIRSEKEFVTVAGAGHVSVSGEFLTQQIEGFVR